MFDKNIATYAAAFFVLAVPLYKQKQQGIAT
jgi:hypothetical protein